MATWDLEAALELILVVGDPVGERKARRGVGVVTAGVHQARTGRGEAFLGGNVVGVGRFGDGHAVDVEAHGERGAGTARVEHADAAREAVHFGEEFFGNAVFARIGDAGVNDLLRTTETVVGIDHLLAREDFVAVGTKRFNDEGGGAEFAPTFFRHGVEVTANFDELIVVSASRGHFVSVS